MQKIPLNTIPNQRLRLTLDGDNWELTLKTARNTMCCDLKLNDEMIMCGMRLMPNTPLIPYQYLQSKESLSRGHFVFVTENDELPWWQNFNRNQSLVYWRRDD
nr:hypothetical protein [uncultured Moellerella sp.]